MKLFEGLLISKTEAHLVSQEHSVLLFTAQKDHIRAHIGAKAAQGLDYSRVDVVVN